ncbi:reverse transcriptase [Elysia marginata]|uniref:Reverse transcriptase n=1 Tax=Elysia marginata TaxID=1093978 RepID=A0AAV4HUT6_9GAST|nr:reverse transcriptase [Elysia marginata]
MKNKAYRNKDRDPASFKKARLDLKKGIKEEKRKHRDKINGLFDTNDTKTLWSNLGQITQYNVRKQTDVPDDIALPDRLNNFYARFERDNNTKPNPLPCDSSSSATLAVDEYETRCALGRLRENEAPGPDMTKPRLLKLCSSQLPPVLTYIFNWSLEANTVSFCFKKIYKCSCSKKGFT